MPSWKTHILFNLIFLLIPIKLFLTFTSDYSILFILIPFSILASLFPDIDSTKSKIRKTFAVLAALTLTLYFFFNTRIDSMITIFVCFILLYFLIRFFPTKHRGRTHGIGFSLVFSLIATITLWIIFTFPLTVFMICFLIIWFGYASHLFLDKVA